MWTHLHLWKEASYIHNFSIKERNSNEQGKFHFNVLFTLPSRNAEEHMIPKTWLQQKCYASKYILTVMIIALEYAS